MKIKIAILSALILLTVFSGYSQDSIRTKNNKPGTPSSLRKADNIPQSKIQINSTTTSNQTDINRPSESNNTNNTTQKTIIITDQNTTAKPNPVTTNTITTTPPATMRTTTQSSAIQNGISNAPKTIRNK